MGRKEDIGLRIRTMRKSRDMTHEDLAKAICQSPSSISMYENGRREPDFETLEAIADVFNVPLVALMLDPVPSEGEKEWSLYVQGHLDAAPKTEEARILAEGIDKLSKEEREQALAVVRAMFSHHADFFMKGSNSDDA